MSLNLIAWINRTGYGYHGMNVVHAAAKLEIDVALWAFGQIEAPAQYEASISKALSNQCSFDYSKPSINISPIGLLSFHVSKGPRVGWTVFEVDKFNAHDAQQIRAQDLVLVTSNWAKDIIAEEFPRTASEVVPEGVDREIFHPEVPAIAVTNGIDLNASTVFINAGKWEERKGQRLLLDAFNKAFEADDNVVLILLCHNRFHQDLNVQWTAMCNQSKLASKILTYNTPLETQNEVAAFMAAADCGVFPSRAEGWNLELLEMMSMGKMVIATDYSAHTQYCTNENCRLIDVDRLEPATDGIWFHGVGEWASWGNHQEDQLIEQLRAVHQLKQNGGDLRNPAGVETAKYFSWEHSVKTLMMAIK